MRWLIWPALVVLLAPFTRPAFAQGAAATGSLVGTVTNKDGGVVSGAIVTARNEATGVLSQVTTNSAGEFRFPSIALGVYSVLVVKDGFKKVSFADVRLQAALARTLNVTLEPGGSTDIVTPGGRNELIRTDTPAVTSTIGSDVMRRLPIADRNPINLVAFLPGVETRGGRIRESIVSGLPPNTIAVTLDGVSSSNTFHSNVGLFSMVVPRADAIEEVSLTTAAAGADSSAQGASHIRLVTRSGTSQYQTRLYEYLGHSSLGAMSFFDRATGLRQARNTSNQYGGSFGGPLAMPGMTGNRGRAFFFLHHEGSSRQAETARTRTLLGAQALSGVFAYGENRAVNLFSLATTFFQTATVDPTVQALLTHIRTVASSCADCSLTLAGDGRNRDSLTWLVPATARAQSPTGRVDLNLGARHRISATYLWQRNSNDPDVLNDGDPSFPGFAARQTQSSVRSLGAVSWRTMLSAALVNEVHLGWQWSPLTLDPAPDGDFANQGGFRLQLGFGLTDAAPDRATLFERQDTGHWTASDTMHWLTGAHHVTTGFSYSRFTAELEQTRVIPTAQLGFSTIFDPAAPMFTTVSFPVASSADLAEARALYALLTGRITAIPGRGVLNDAATAYVFNGPLVQRERMDALGLFAEDTWRWRPNLTLTLGVRYELQLPMTPVSRTFTTSSLADACGPAGFGVLRADGRPCNMFNPGVPNAPDQVPAFVLASPGKAAYGTDMNNIAPVLGFSWQPRAERRWLQALLGDPNQATVSAGFTRSFVRERFDRFDDVFGGNPGTTVPATRAPSGSNFPLADPFPLLLRQCVGIAGNGRCAPEDFQRTPSFPLFASRGSGHDIRIFDPNLQVGFTDSWTIGLQRTLGPDMAIELRYTGSVNRDTWTTENWNLENIFENQFLDEFKLAMENLQANVAAGLGATFAHTGAVTGTSPLPIFLAHLSGLPFSAAGDPVRYSSSGFTNPAILQALNPFAPDVYGVAAMLTAAPFLNNMRTAGLPANFWVMNPLVDDVEVMRNQDRSSRAHVVTVDVRRRLARGLMMRASYSYARQHAFVVPNGDVHHDLLKVRVDNVPHALKMLWVYELPVGRGRRLGSSWNGFLDAALGGWEVAGTGRMHQPTFRLSNTVIEGMSFETAQSLFQDIRIAIDPATGAQLVFNMPQDVIDNTQLAFATDPRQPGFYAPGAAPTDRYFAPATCDRLPLAPGDCVPDLVFQGRWFAEFDLRLSKAFALGRRASLAFGVELFNVFNATNFVQSLSLTGPDAFRITSPASAARTGQLVWRVHW